MGLVYLITATLAPVNTHGEDARTSTGLVPSTPVITIEADSFNLFVLEEKAVFRGNVNASQGNHTFRSGQLTVHLDQVDTQRARQSDGEEGAGANSSAFELSARTLRYDIESDIVVGQGDSQLRRGEELIAAEVINYDFLRRVAYAVPDEGGRVKVRFFSNPERPLFPSRTLARSTAAE